MAFKLNIEKAPFLSFYWWAEYSQGESYSGWLDVYLTGKGEPWNCPYGAFGATDLKIQVVGKDYSLKHEKTGLGPIYDAHEYIYNCDTKQLRDVSKPKGEIRDIQYWNPISGLWENSPPTFATGHWNGLALRGVNLTDKDLRMYMWFYAYDPNGRSVGAYQTKTYVVKPGTGFSANYGVYCELPGDYTTKCELYIEGIGKVDEVTEVVSHVIEAPVIDARIDTWWLWDYEEGWVDVSPTLIPLNEDIGIRVRVKNTSGFQLDIRADVRYLSPSGKKKTLTGDIITVPPGLFPDDYPFWDFLWVATEWGDWQCDIILYAGLPGGSLSEVDRRENVAVAHVAEEAPPEAEFKNLAVSYRKGV